MTRATEIRLATPADASSVVTIIRGLHDENIGLPKDMDAERAGDWITRLGDQGAIYLAYDGSIPVAFGALDFDTSEPDTALLGVWVLPEYRRRGIATAVADALVAHARQGGFRRIRGRLPQGNEPALSFLSSIGAMVPLRNPAMRFELPLT
jgi:ribosomal protein S18 acetylase RimI-like enzyme